MVLGMEMGRRGRWVGDGDGFGEGDGLGEMGLGREGRGGKWREGGGEER